MASRGLYETRKDAERVTIQVSAAQTSSDDGSAVAIPFAQGIVFEFDVTAAATLAGDTLDLKIQTRIDGTNWVDVITFTQVLGNGGTKRFFAKLSAAEPQAMFENATALTAGNIRHLLGEDWRASWTIAGTGSFTFSVTAIPQ